MKSKYLRWRWDMLRHWPSVRAYARRARRMVEVGTWRGDSARRWIEQADVQHLTCVDPYRAKHDASWESTQEACNEARAVAKIKLAGHVYNGRLTWMHEFSPGASANFEDASLDVVYVDGDHSLQAAQEDLTAWWPKLRPGGVLIVDDYLTGRWWGEDVMKAVDCFEPMDQRQRRRHGRWFVITKNPATVKPAKATPWPTPQQVLT